MNIRPFDCVFLGLSSFDEGCQLSLESIMSFAKKGRTRIYLYI